MERWLDAIFAWGRTDLGTVRVYVKRLLRFLGFQILLGYITPPNTIHCTARAVHRRVVATAWRTGCETIRHMTDGLRGRHTCVHSA
jgi:hypothetical protein